MKTNKTLYRSELKLPLADTLARIRLSKVSVFLSLLPTTLSPFSSPPGKQFQCPCCLFCLVLNKNRGLWKVLPCCSHSSLYVVEYLWSTKSLFLIIGLLIAIFYPFSYINCVLTIVFSVISISVLLNFHPGGTML